MPTPDANERYAFEFAVEELRRFHGPTHQALVEALESTAAAEVDALLASGADGILQQQGRARMARETLDRVKNAGERLKEASERRARAAHDKRNQSGII